MMNARENAIRAIKRENPEWVPNFETEIDVIMTPSCINERLWQPGYDWFGVYWREFMPYTDGHAPLVSDISDWKDVVRIPDLDAIDWEGCAARDCENLDRENKILWIPDPIGLFERMHALMSFDDALCSFYDDPEAVKELLDALTEWKIDLFGRIIKYYKPDVIQMHDDYGTQRAPFLAPDLWREFFKDNLKKISDSVRSRNVFFFLHSCGKIDELIGDFVDCGFDGWDSVMRCNDLETIGKKYGDRLSFSPAIGNQKSIDSFTEEEAREEVRWYINALGHFGGVIPRPVTSMIVSEKIGEIMVDEVEKYGKTYYKNQDKGN